MKMRQYVKPMIKVTMVAAEPMLAASNPNGAVIRQTDADSSLPTLSKEYKAPMVWDEEEDY